MTNRYMKSAWRNYSTQLTVLVTFIVSVVVMATITGTTPRFPDSKYFEIIVEEKEDFNLKVHRHHAPSSTHQRSEEDRALVTKLAADLKAKLLVVNGYRRMDSALFNKTCKDHNITNYDDSNKCLRKHIPVELEERVESLAFIDNMPIPQEVWSAMDHMRAQIKGKYDVIIVSAASANHYHEQQALIRNLHNEVFPVLKNFKFIFYDIGLKPEQKAELKKHCRCTILDFPFSKLPEHFSTIKCFSWKTFVLATHYSQAEVIMWTDSSIRYHNGSSLQTMVQRTKERGVQQRLEYGRMTPNFYHTLASMYESFGDSPCSHGNHIRQCETGWGMYHNEPLIWHTVMLPWLSCASNRFCQCPQNPGKTWDCGGKRPPNTISMCLRADQSAMSIILARLFREYYYQFGVPVGWFQEAKRGDGTLDYFPSLEKALPQTTKVKESVPKVGDIKTTKPETVQNKHVVPDKNSTSITVNKQKPT